MPEMHPYNKANWISKLFFWWLGPLLRKGYKKTLELDDMYPLLDENKTNYLTDCLEREWDKKIHKRGDDVLKPSLNIVLAQFVWKTVLTTGVLVTIEEVCKIVTPLFVSRLVTYFSVESDITTQDAYVCASVIVLLTIVANAVHHPFYYFSQLLGMNVRVACSGLIYRKALKLSSIALTKTTVGQAVNLLSNDVNRFDQVFSYMHFIWIAPLQLVVVTALLWQQLGPSCLAGVSIILLMILIQAKFGALFSKYREKTAKLTDERIRFMNEIIAGMRVIKMYAWEKPFTQLVSDCRKREISKILKSTFLRGSTFAFFFTTTSLASFATFVVYSLAGNALTARKVYLAIPLYNVLRLDAGLFLPIGIMMVTESIVSLRRIKEFLMLEELVNEEDNNNRHNSRDGEVKVENVSASWNHIDGKTSANMVLKNISLNIKGGEILAVVGPVGCGKSSLLMAIMGEMSDIIGDVMVPTRLAYTSQLPCIFAGTIRENIVFGKPYEKEKFDDVIKICALNEDLEVLPKREETLVGERGVKLSGGQKARIGLARAVYMDMDVYLLDDPLSAVDAHVGKHLFNVCIRNKLKDKACILVTHQLQYLDNVNKILVMKDGQVAGYGTYNELQSSGIDFASLLKAQEPENDEFGSHHLQRNESKETKSLGDSPCSLQSIQPKLKEENEEETKRVGNISANVYSRYFTAGGTVWFLILFCIINVAVQSLLNTTDWWLSYWVFNEETAQEEFYLVNSNYTADRSTLEFNSNWYIYIFSALTGVLILLNFLRTLTSFTIAVNASENLHNEMFQAIVRAPIRFFDINPVGRILNRFAKDIGYMDDLLPMTLADFVQVALMVIGIVITVAIFNPFIFIVVVPLGLIFIWLRRYYLQTSRDIKRMEGITRSPAFSHLSATLNGLHTLRAFKVQQSFVQTFENHQDQHSQAWYLFLASSRYFGICLDWLVGTFIAVVTFGSVLLSDVSNLNSGYVGLSLSYALSLMCDFQWGVRQSAELENLMTSTERVIEFTDVAPEAPLESNLKPASDWPKDGLITFEDVSLAYYDGGPTVLKNLHCCIKSREKVGVAGRTGAGKSSLMTALLRLAEPTGKILIDGVSIEELGLHNLRKNISIIPQDPVIFTGSLRRNLDPFEEHTETDLWKALEEVELKTTVSEFSEKMDTQINEGGTNLSVGQRQLLCLARAILRQTRILIIDEATANVDIRTDQLIQYTIRKKFNQCTVLTIAHRLNTIMDSDRILILDQGCIVEFDKPFLLLQKENGILTKMVSESGRKEAAKLLSIAKEKHYSNNL